MRYIVLSNSYSHRSSSSLFAISIPTLLIIPLYAIPVLTIAVFILRIGDIRLELARRLTRALGSETGRWTGEIEG